MTTPNPAATADFLPSYHRPEKIGIATPSPNTDFPSLSQRLAQMDSVRAALVAFLFATLFILPFFFHLGSAGFIYTGDIYHSWMPQIMKSGSLFSHGIFSGLDYSTHSGSSEFFLRPNMIIYEPLLIIASLVMSLATTTHVSAFLVMAFYLHYFLGCFFAIKLAREMLSFDFATSVFVGVFYTFSLYSERNFGFPPFVFIATLFPAIIYAGFASFKYRNPLVSLLCSIPILMGFLSGYIALSIAAAFFASVFLFVWLVVIRRVEQPITALFYAFLPFAIATFVAAPYYIAVFDNNVHTDAYDALSSVFASAHQLAENPRTVLRAISEGISFTGPLYEQSLFIGILPLALLALALSNSWILRPDDSTARRSIIFNGLSYGLFVLLMFGSFSVLSDMFFYLLPGIGKMHIYQRFLVFAQLSLAIVCGHILQLFLEQEPSHRKLSGRGGIIAGLLVVLVGAATFLNLQPSGQMNAAGSVNINDRLVFDLLVASLAFAIWHFTNSVRVFTVLATIAVFLIPASRGYDFGSDSSYHKEEQASKHLEMNPAYFDSVGRFLGQKDTGKSIVRVLNMEPGVTEAFSSLNLPWYLLPTANVSDYNGYDFSLAAPVDYRQLFPVFLNDQKLLEFRFDRAWLEYTNLDFVIYKPSMLKTHPELASIIDVSSTPWFMTITPDLAIAPTIWRTQRMAAGGQIDPAVDNGYFRLESADPLAKMTDFKTNKASLFTIDVSASKPSTLHYLFWKNKHLQFFVDGNRVEPLLKADRYVSVWLPAGHHEITVRYNNALIDIFLAEYLLYTVAAFGALIWLVNRARAHSRQEHMDHAPAT
jgi:hypothetical protein